MHTWVQVRQLSSLFVKIVKGHYRDFHLKAPRNLRLVPCRMFRSQCIVFSVSCDSPLYIRSHSKAVLNRAIEQDTKFLADNSVMDYSLLVGLEPSSDELVLGIIGKCTCAISRGISRQTENAYKCRKNFINWLCNKAKIEKHQTSIVLWKLHFSIRRLHKNVHLGQEAGNYGKEVRHIGRTG